MQLLTLCLLLTRPPPHSSSAGLGHPLALWPLPPPAGSAAPRGGPVQAGRLFPHHPELLCGGRSTHPRGTSVGSQSPLGTAQPWHFLRDLGLPGGSRMALSAPPPAWMHCVPLLPALLATQASTEPPWTPPSGLHARLASVSCCSDPSGSQAKIPWGHWDRKAEGERCECLAFPGESGQARRNRFRAALTLP